MSSCRPNARVRLACGSMSIRWTGVPLRAEQHGECRGRRRLGGASLLICNCDDLHWPVDPTGYHVPAALPSTFLPALRHCQNAGISGNLALPALRGAWRLGRANRGRYRETRQETSVNRDREVPGNGAGKALAIPGLGAELSALRWRTSWIAGVPTRCYSTKNKQQPAAPLLLLGHGKNGNTLLDT